MAQISMSLPSATISTFQGMFLFFMLAADVLVAYQPRWQPRRTLAEVRAGSPNAPAKAVK
jgi:ABC-type uncharacterized transport system permease subunit